MRSFLIILFMCFCFTLIYPQTFTESAFNASKCAVDTSENNELLQLCNNTFERLLMVSQNDSSILFYNVLCQTKMAYLALQTNTLSAMNYLNNTKTQLNYLDSNFHFGIETKIISLFQKIIANKANSVKENNLIAFDKEIENFYLKNKQTARANLVYAIYLYHFKKTQKKVTESLIKRSLVLFEKEESLKLFINWGKHLAKNLLNSLKQMN